MPRLTPGEALFGQGEGLRVETNEGTAYSLTDFPRFG